MTTRDLLVWAIAFVATAGVIVRPFRLPEAVWAVAGASLLVLAGLLPWRQAAAALGRGTDVYLFLTGMMLLSEVARREGLFDWLAAFAVRRSGGSATRLFLLIYAVGTLVTAFLSNDATAVVLTPAVFAAAKAARVADKLPYLFVCAFIANAASFLLPISNPANIVLYASHTPKLLDWLGRFALPAALAILATYVSMRLALRAKLRGSFDADVRQPALSAAGRGAAAGIVATAAVLLGASFLDAQLGLPTAIMGALTAAIVLLRKREAPWPMLAGISWAVLPLIAGLFVLVQGLDDTGVVAAIGRALHASAARAAGETAWVSGAGLALVANLMNNLPAGLVAAQAIASAHPPLQVTDSLLIGVDLGPNLSVTGSLATILWLTALRREGESVSFRRFLRLGAVVMPPALLLALAGRLLA